MKRLALLFACVTTFASGAALAAEPEFCRSMCDSAQRECRAGAGLQAKAERSVTSNDLPDRNPLARTAQLEVPGSATRALGASGDDNRRMARIGECADTYQRCTRSCAAPQSSVLTKPRG